jgi:hypothetical protein
MNIQQIKNHDLISGLPTDESEVVENELQILNMIFKENPSSFKAIFKEFYELLIIGILFILFSLPYIDNIVQSVLPITNNYYFLVVIKAIFVMFLFWVSKYFNYSRRYAI